MKKYNLYIACLAMFLLISNLLQAQVTIGSGNSPAKGMLLQIKDTEPTDPKTNNETATRGGLILPRVALEKINGLEPFIANATPDEMKEHEGLIVYNTNNCLNAEGNDNGLYGWYGTSWRKMGEEEELSPAVYEVIDPRDEETYLARNFGATAGDWMLENMRYVPKVGDGFTHTATSSNTAKYYIYSEGNEDPYVPANHPSAEWETKKKNGLLYNWTAATNGGNTSTINQAQGEATSGPSTPVRGICPVNWHVASDKEWNDLERELYKNAQLYSSHTKAEVDAWNASLPWLTAWETTTIGYRPAELPPAAQGSAMKSPCPPVGSSYPPVGSSYPTKGKSLTVRQGGLNLLLTGYVPNGNLASYGGSNFLWSSSTFDSLRAWYRHARAGDASILRPRDERRGFMAVRCKKN